MSCAHDRLFLARKKDMPALEALVAKLDELNAYAVSREEFFKKQVAATNTECKEKSDAIWNDIKAELKRAGMIPADFDSEKLGLTFEDKDQSFYYYKRAEGGFFSQLFGGG